jgi:hypothetical protein
MKDWIELLVAFVLGFFMKSLMGTICQSRLVEGSDPEQTTVLGRTISFHGACAKCTKMQGDVQFAQL